MWLLIAFIAVPLIEIALFIQVGGFLGLWPTLLIVVVTAIIGTFLVRQQGLQTLNQLRSQLRDVRDPTETLAHGAMILFSGALLLTPGFFTDAVGFLLLVPAFRLALFREARKRVVVHQMKARPQPDPRHPPRRGPSVIDGDYEDVSGDAPGRTPPSGWTKGHRDR